MGGVIGPPRTARCRATQDRHRVGHVGPDRHVLQRPQVAEAGGANAQAVRLRRPLRNKVDAVLAARVLAAHVHLARRRPQQPRHSLRHDRTVRQLRQRLTNDPHRLADLLQAHQVAVVGVAVRADRDVPVEAVVDAVRLVLAQVELHAGRPQHRAGHAEVDRLFRAQPADVARARDENLVVRQQPVHVVGADQRLLAHPLRALLEVARHVPGDAARPEVGVHQPVAGDLLEQVEDVLALPEGVDERGTEDAQVGPEGAQEHEVAGNPVQLRQDDADVLRPLRRLQMPASFSTA